MGERDRDRVRDRLLDPLDANKFNKHKRNRPLRVVHQLDLAAVDLLALVLLDGLQQLLVLGEADHSERELPRSSAHSRHVPLLFVRVGISDFADGAHQVLQVLNEQHTSAGRLLPLLSGPLVLSFTSRLGSNPLFKADQVFLSSLLHASSSFNDLKRWHSVR